MNKPPQKELGIIFIVSYTIEQDSSNRDIENIKQSFKDFRSGIFDYGNYEVCNNTDICFVKSIKFNEDKSPHTEITWLESDAATGRYGGEVMFADYKSINIGDKDVLSTLLVSLTKIINAKEYILFLYSHSSLFGLFDVMANPASAVRTVKKAIGQLKNIHTEDIVGTSVLTELKSNTDPQSFEDLIEKIKSNYASEVEIRTQDFLKEDVIEAIAGSKENFKINSLKNHFKGAVTGIDPEKLIPVAHNIENPVSGNYKEVAGNVIDTTFEASRHTENLIDYKADMLTNSELQLALSRAFDNNLLILFNAGCFSMNVETIYTLRNSAKFIVGAQSIMPPHAYNFPAIINSIAKLKQGESESLTDEDCIKIITDGLAGLPGKYKADPTGEMADWLLDIVITAVATSKVEELRKCMDDFVLYCFKNPQSAISNFERDGLKDLSNIYHPTEPANLQIVDLKTFISRFKRRMTDEEIKTICDQITDTCDSLLITGILYGSESLKEFFNGLSVFFPEKFEDAFDSYNFTTFYSPVSKMESSFSEDSFWGEFLYFYFKYCKKMFS